MQISDLISRAFGEARHKQASIAVQWNALSFQWGSKLPASNIRHTIQRAGQLDTLLRCLENEIVEMTSSFDDDPYCKADDLIALSELWILTIYEIFRHLRSRRLFSPGDRHESLYEDLSRVRMPLAKHEIPTDDRLKRTIDMKRTSHLVGDDSIYTYDRKDNLRAHIMPTRLTPLGSVSWWVIDHQNDKEYWVERRDLSDRILALAAPINPA
ncbi:hypothetical protein [Methylorubrum aminovorans]